MHSVRKAGLPSQGFTFLHSYYVKLALCILPSLKSAARCQCDRPRLVWSTNFCNPNPCRVGLWKARVSPAFLFFSAPSFPYYSGLHLCIFWGRHKGQDGGIRILASFLIMYIASRHHCLGTWRAIEFGAISTRTLQNPNPTRLGRSLGRSWFAMSSCISNAEIPNPPFF